MRLPEDDVRALMQAGEAEVDLEALEVRFDGRAVAFELDPETRRRLLEGLDEIALAEQQGDAIDALRGRARRPRPAGAGDHQPLTRPVIAATGCAHQRTSVRKKTVIGFNPVWRGYPSHRAVRETPRARETGSTGPRSSPSDP